MAGFLFAFVAALLIGQGARDQLVVARLAAATGKAGLVAGWAAAIVSASFMAWAGATIATIVPPAGRQMLVAFALLAAAVELAWPNRVRDAAEPTRSVGAIFVVLLARQLGDASRFAIFALAAATALPALSGIGGAVGGGAAITIGWTMGARLERDLPLRAIRIALACATFVLALLIGLTARGIV